MPTAVDTRDVRLAAIMFTDMVGYSALCQKSESLAAQLLEEHRRRVRSALPRHGGREVATTGDGFLLEFHSALQAVQFAIALQQGQASRNAAAGDRRFEFRCGIHLGEIEAGRAEITGDGVNIAARLEPLSPPGGVAISAAVHAVVRNRIAADFRPIGTPPLKNIAEPVPVFVLDAAAVQAVTIPGESRKLRRGSGSRPLWTIAVGIAFIAVGALGWVSRSHVDAHVAPSDKSVAVLPLASFSGDKDGEYFADGVQDAIITSLAHVSDLKVISRTSVMEYKDKARNLREIGRQLGVANIVEGSVQRAGNRVRVTAQLIRVADDRHLWADSYDRDVADIFAIQSDVAQQIVNAVSAKLTADEKARIEQRPTQNAEAYDYFVRAIDTVWEDVNALNEDRALRFLEHAIELDPNFAAAHGTLAWVIERNYWYHIDSSPAALERARKEIEISQKLEPGNPSALVAQGMYDYWILLDWEKAHQQFDLALQARPGYDDALAFKGFAYRRQGKIDDALTYLKKAMTLGPRRLIWIDGAATAYQVTRRYPEADALYQQVIELGPDIPSNRLPAAFCRMRWHGDLKPLQETLDAIGTPPDPSFAIARARAQLAEYQGRYADAIKHYESIAEPSAWNEGAGRVPRELMIAREYAFAGDAAKARPHFEQARDWLRANPDKSTEWFQHVQLGQIAAYLGDAATARSELQLAEKTNRNPIDPILRPDFRLGMAEAYLRVGDPAAAFEQLEQAIALPSIVNGYDLRWNPAFKALRGNPRFEKLIADNI